MPVYKFSSYLFDTELEQIKSGDEVVRLEPQQAKLLLFLVRNNRSIVSRDKIAQEVWQNLIVEDNTISKAITRLRKVLQDDAKSPRYIKTIPKKGYQFIAEIQQVETNTPTNAIAEPVETTNILLISTIFSAFLFFTIILFVVWLLISDSPAKNSKDLNLQPSVLTYREGFDTNANLSPNGQQLLFVGAMENGYGIFRKALTSATAQQLFSVNSANIYPKWMTNNKFIYAMLNEQNQCIIVEHYLDAPSFQRVLTHCLSSKPIEVQVNNEAQHIFWQDDSGLWQLDLPSLKRELLPFDMTNVKYQLISTDRNYWAGLYHLARGSEILVFDLKEQSLVHKISLPHQITHFRWSHTNQAIYYLSEHPAKQIWKHSFSGEKSLVSSTTFGFISQLNDSPALNTLEFVISAVDLDIEVANIVKPTTNKAFYQVNSAFPDYHPAISPDLSKLAFASKRTGTAQIWLRQSTDEFTQLTHFDKASYIYALEWSPDNQHILVNRNESIYIIDTQSSDATILPLNAKQKFAWQWIDATTIAFIDEQNNSLFSFDIRSHNQQLLKTNVRHAQYEEKHWFIQEMHQQNVARYNDKFQSKKSIYAQLNQRNWRINNTDLFIYNVNNKSLSKVGSDGNEVIVLRNIPNISSLKRAGDNSFVFHKVSSNEANIYQLHLPAD